MKEWARNFWSDESAAIAPTLAIIMFVLVAAAGIAFDYSRLATLDTELQNAADQAALAAAGQLDGSAGSRARATAAAQNLVENLTYFANDNDTDGTSISIANVEFYRNYDADRANLSDPPGDAATDDSNANYVRVTVETRRANFAFTPVVAAFGSNATAHALAGLGTAYCNVPPFMMCQPTPTFDADANAGRGLRLVMGNTNSPGNFGFLQTGFGEGAENLGRAIGYNGSYGGCIGQADLTTEPGNNQSVRSALNTRFDITDGGQSCPDLPGGGSGTCSPSTNVRKDLVRGTNCGTSGNQGWREAYRAYRAPNANPLSAANPMIAADGTNPAVPYPSIMGHPRDLCHAHSEDGSCANGRIGSGTWDRDAYFHVNYGWDAAGSGTANDWTTRTGLSSTASRYQVYLWEAANPLPGPQPTDPGLGNPQTVDALQGQQIVQRTGYGEPICRGVGVSPSDPAQDRRRITVAVVSCPDPRDPAGRDQVSPIGWMDVFLVEPSFSRPGRTDNGDIYVEVIGSRTLPGIGGTSGTIVRRDVPQLLE